VHLFDGVPPAERAKFASRLTHRRLVPGEDLIVQGQAPRNIYLLESGHVDVWRLDAKGAKRRLNRLGVGATCGEVSLLTGNPASATATAATEVAVTVMTAPEFFDIAAQFPIVYRNVGAILADRLVNADRRTEEVTPGSLVWIVDHGAPPLLSYALACSIAWHTHTETAMFVADPEDWRDVLNPSLLGPFEGTGAKGARPQATVQHRGPVAASALATAEPLRHRGANVLIHLSVAEQATAGQGKVVHVTRRDHGLASSGTAVSVVLRGWSDHPAHTRVRSDAPGPRGADQEALRRGVLPLGTPLGDTVGRVARGLCGLRVGIALGEGSAKGFAHLGVLRSLERAGVPCDAIAGTSIGAPVAGLYAAGFSLDDSLAHLVKVGSSTFRPVLRRGSFMSHTGVERIMRSVWGDSTRIEDLSIPFAAVAADIATGSEVVLNRGLLWAAALASISIPGVYPPQRMGELLLVDGGVVNPVPSDVARALGSDVVVAVRLAAGRQTVPVLEADASPPSGRVPSVIHTVLRARDLMQNRNRTAIGAASVLIEPDFPANISMGLRDFSRGQRFVELGERAGQSAVPHIARLLPWLSSPNRP
jgi:NTE family protein